MLELSVLCIIYVLFIVLCIIRIIVFPIPERHAIYSDSLYTINMTTGQWVPRTRGKRNAHLIAKLRKQYRDLQRTSAGIAIRHVRSHIKVPGNELADHVADMARGGGITLQAARAWLVAWVGRQQMPGGLGDRTGVG